MKIVKLIMSICLFAPFSSVSGKEKGIKFKQEYVEKFYSLAEDRDYEYEEVGKVKLNNKLIVELFNIKGWTGDEPGDFRKIRITNKNGKKTEFINIGGWWNLKKSPTNWTTIDYCHFNKKNLVSNPYLLYLDLGENTQILLAFGCTYGNHGWLTIISLKNDIPQIIFNQKVKLLEIIENNDSCKLRVQFGSYAWYGNEKKNEKGNLIPRDPSEVTINDIYIKNNELIIENVHFTLDQILDLIAKVTYEETGWRKEKSK